MLRREFGFHELALEDTLRRGQRPKVDQYEGYYFIVLYTVRSEPEIVTNEVHCFWGSNYFVSVHEGPVPEIRTAVERWVTSGERLRQGVAYQVYALFDAVVDGYFPVVDAVAERIEDLEDRVFSGDDPEVVRDVFEFRRQLFAVRRVIAPLRDVLNELIRRDVPVFPRTLIPYLTDVYDHAIRVIDALDLQRDLLASAMESYLSATSNRLNQTMRTLTAYTIALIVPTLIAGVYGMNYRLIPRNDTEWGFGFAVALMGVSMIGLLAWFKRNGWL
jgi:magnesium transporter